MMMTNRILLSLAAVSTFLAASIFVIKEYDLSATSAYRRYAFKLASDREGLRMPMVQLVTSESRAVIPSQLSPARSKPTRRAEKINKLEQGLASARAAIRKSASLKNQPTVNGSTNMIYLNPDAFHQSYKEMERRFKVYVYKEGEFPLVHHGPCKDAYSIEGRFIHEMEHGKKNRFRTSDSGAAHVYFMPFSVTWMVKYLLKPNTYDVTPLKDFVSDYVKLISKKHPFWNASQGADHFMLSCHDWGPHASRGNDLLYNTSIRALCNANTSEGFSPQKDVSLPEVRLYDGKVSPKLVAPDTSTPRPHLAFFAGGVHGPVRPILLDHWKGKDSDLRVYEYLPANEDYDDHLLKSRFCLCPSGYEVATPRVLEAIYAGCVPVILSHHFVLPLSDVLKWEAFSIRVDVSEIPRLKDILSGVSEGDYLRLKEGLRLVRRHFVLNQPPQRFDMFHMILHSVWLRRLNLKID